VIDVAARTSGLTRASTRDLPARWFWAGAVAAGATVAVVLAVILRTWPPHEDEALALFVGRQSLPQLLHTVIAERGGAPLHFLFAWAIAHLGGGLTALRVVSLVFAAASVPVIAALGARLADRLVGLVAAVLAAGTWVLLFHGVYGRMYSLFLFTSALSFLALLDALEHGGRRRFALWGIALLATLASHPYAVLVLGAQGLYVLLRRERLRPALVTLGAVVVAAAPFWWADVVLRGRFNVGLGGGGSRLGSPHAVVHYFWWVAGDFSAGHHEWSTPVLVTAGIGFMLLALRRRTSALLIACVVLVPGIVFTLAKLNSTASPEARHLIFALPFFSTLLAVALVEVGRLRPPLTPVVALAAVAVLLVGEVRWAERKTPPLFHGDPPGEARARAQASNWLASRARSDDVALGYEPLYLGAWERNHSFSRYALPRADPQLFADALCGVPEPLGRGIWIFDASDTTNLWERQTIRFELPHPASAFEGRVFGPYLVIRSRRPLGTRDHYLAVSEEVMRLGRRLQIGDADINLHTMLLATKRL
jgi:hypothetical protein